MHILLTTLLFIYLAIGFGIGMCALEMWGQKIIDKMASDSTKFTPMIVLLMPAITLVSLFAWPIVAIVIYFSPKP